MALDLQALQRPLGPLPVWAWGTLGGGVLILLMARNGHPGAAKLISATTPTPAAPGDLTTQPTQPLPTQPGQPAQPVSIVPPGSSVYDPNTGKATPGVSLADLLGGQSLTDVIAKLGPDYQQFSLTDNGLGASVSHSAQNVLDTEANVAHDTNYYNSINAYGHEQAVAGAAEYAAYQQAQASEYGAYEQAVLGTNQAAYNSVNVHDTNVYGSYNQASQSNAATAASYYDYLSRLSATQNNAGVTTTPNVPAPVAVVSPGVAASSPSCANGNFSCIRSYCTSGNNSCAQGVAPWFNPATMRF